MELYRLLRIAVNIIEEDALSQIDKGLYVHFTDDPSKFGIHPKRGQQTSGGPLGLYTYEWATNSLPYMSFGSSRKFITLIECLNPESILDTNSYSESDLKSDISKLNSFVEKRLVNKAISLNKKYIDNGSLDPIFGSPIGMLYYVVSKIPKNLDPEDPISYGGNNLADYRYFSEVMQKLGYIGIQDQMGLIWKSEPHQTVFFDMNQLKVVGTFNNPFNK